MYDVYYSYNQIKFYNQSIKDLKQLQKKWPIEWKWSSMAILSIKVIILSQKYEHFPTR